MHMQDELITSNLLFLWLGFSLAFVVLVSLWVFISFGRKGGGPNGNVPSRWRQLAARAMLFILVGAGALGSAAAHGAEWTGVSMWVGIAIAFWVVAICFGDLRKWGGRVD